MSMFIVFLCCGLCYGYGSVETRAAVPPGRSGDAVDTPFHRGRLLYKREPRPSASSSKAITTFIADFTNLLLKDLTEMIKTRMSLFPPGSRAAVSERSVPTFSDGSVDERRLADVDNTNVGEGKSAVSNMWWRMFSKMTSPWIWGSVVTVTIVGALCTMMPGQGGVSREQNFNHRTPPAWSPDMEHHYSFRAWMTDISLWVMLTDLAPHQQCSAIIMRLGGPAREFARMISPQEIMTGGIRNGRLLDPVSYLLGALQLRFSNLEEETRLQSMTEMLAFTRKPGENINALLARYEVVRQRAANEGHFVMSIEGCALQILRAVGVHANQLTNLLQQFGGRLPNNEAEYHAMITQVRRQGHIQEAAPGNIATVLQGPLRQARPGTYYVGSEGGQTVQQQLQSYWTEPQPQSSAAQQSIAPWANPDSGSQWADAGQGYEAGWSSGWRLPEPGPTEAWNPTQPGLAYFDTQNQEETDSSATSSDSGNEQLPEPGVSGMSMVEAAHHIYLQMRTAKRTWRRFTGRPVRRFRRFFKASRGKCKGKSKGKRSPGQAFMYTQDEVNAFLSGKGKGGRSHSSGKGFGRKKNPKDRN